MNLLLQYKADNVLDVLLINQKVGMINLRKTKKNLKNNINKLKRK